MWKIKMFIKLLVGNLKGRSHSGEKGVDGG
jgi:hypothetical protein